MASTSPEIRQSIARLYPFRALEHGIGLEEALEGETTEALPEVQELALELAKDLEALGPTYVKLGQLLSTRPDILPLPFIEALTRLQDDVEPISFAEVEGVVTAELGVRVPPELALLGKTLLNLDQVGRALHPTFDPNAAIRRHADLTSARVRRSLSMGSLLGAAVEMKDFLQRFPARVNRLLDTVADNRLKIQVDAIDEKLLVEGINKVANRITMGLVLAAMIVGAAMLMRVETSFRILGYPGLAMLLFLVAAGCGLALVVNIFVSDHRAEREARSLRKEGGPG